MRIRQLSGEASAHAFVNPFGLEKGFGRVAHHVQGASRIFAA